jgi:hypothetical protein
MLVICWLQQMQAPPVISALEVPAGTQQKRGITTGMGSHCITRGDVMRG